MKSEPIPQMELNGFALKPKGTFISLPSQAMRFSFTLKTETESFILATPFNGWLHLKAARWIWFLPILLTTSKKRIGMILIRTRNTSSGQPGGSKKRRVSSKKTARFLSAIFLKSSLTSKLRRCLFSRDAAGLSGITRTKQIWEAIGGVHMKVSFIFARARISN